MSYDKLHHNSLTLLHISPVLQMYVSYDSKRATKYCLYIVDVTTMRKRLVQQSNHPSMLCYRVGLSWIYDIIYDAGDSLTRHAGHSFSTKDRGNDVYRGHCARNHKGAWWYYACDASNLNGLYLGGPHASYADGIEWSSWYGQQYSLKKVEMKLRP